MIGPIEYAQETWLTKPNHERAPVISVGLGKSLMAVRIFSDGAVPVGVIESPAKSTVLRQNLNFDSYSTMPLLAHSVR